MASAAYRNLLSHELRRGTARSIIAIATFLIADAYIHRASDVHIDPAVSGTQVRLRIDGLLSDPYTLPRDCHVELIARLKILSRLRTDEHFSPQDGAFTFTLPDGSTAFDIRLSIVPAHNGECAVLRLLIPLQKSDSFVSLGMTPAQECLVEKALTLPHGLILIVGPTGSGKTTTLYACIRRLVSTRRAVVSIEDPVEYCISGVRQVSVLPHHGLTFAIGLRSLLRQDPDVIVVGEIRDAETAALALSAAHTGHLVLSTLHATSASSAYGRLEELAITDRRIAAAQPLIISQKLVQVPDNVGRQAEFEITYATA